MLYRPAGRFRVTPNSLEPMQTERLSAVFHSTNIPRPVHTEIMAGVASGECPGSLTGAKDIFVARKMWKRLQQLQFVISHQRRVPRGNRNDWDQCLK